MFFRLILPLLLMLQHVDPVLADDGEDFINNLYSDLAPLLSLFGERVTMQFMSQAIGLADCVIVAMAPLGILTIIVSAIRVGGPSLLKAIIGRARESRAAAEMELMSSTSDEICELWDGRNVVRCQGSAKMSQFICVMPESWAPSQERPEVSVNFKSLKEAENDGSIRETQVTFLKKMYDWMISQITSNGGEDTEQHSDDKAQSSRQSQPSNEDIERGEQGESANPGSRASKFSWPATGKSLQALFRRKGSIKSTNEGRNQSELSQPGPGEIVIIGDSDSAAPNLSLNCHNNSQRTELYLIAVVAVLIQLGALVYYGLIVYYSPLNAGYGKNGQSVAWYAFPATTGGTLTLVLALFICAWVIEQSTDEAYYEAREDHKLYVVWLQKGGTVNDQVFKPFAIYPRDVTRYREIVTFSRRKTDNNQTGNKKSTDSQDEGSLQMKIITTSGTGISLLGFVFQFIGFRSMNWTASLVQLGAVVFMTILRALVRRGFASRPEATLLKSDFELDWFALSFQNLRKAAWLNLSSQKSSQNGINSSGAKPDLTWVVVTGGLGQQQYKEMDWHEDQWQERAVASDVMRIRKYLGTLTKWQEPVTPEALRLARAMEVVMNFFFTPYQTITRSIWLFQIQCGNKKQEVRINITLIGGQWKVDARDIDAILSLWLYTVQSQKTTIEDHRELGDGDKRCRANASLESGMRLFGSSNKARLLRDLQWWIADGAPEMLEVKTSEERDTAMSMQKDVQLSRVVGFGMGQAMSVESLGQTRTFECREVSIKNYTRTDNRPGETGREDCVLAVECFDALERLYARDLFYTFMRSVARDNTAWVETTSAKITDHTDDNPWDKLKLHHEGLSKLAQKIEEVGFGSSAEIYFEIIGSFGMEQKLPKVEFVVTKFHQRLQELEKTQGWSRVPEACSDLLYLAMTFDPQQDRLYPRSVAICFEYLRRMHVACSTQETEQRDAGGLRETYNEFVKEVVGMFQNERLSSALLVMEVVFEGDTKWKAETLASFKISKSSNDGGDETKVYPDSFRLHHLPLKNNPWCLDAFDRLPIHYTYTVGANLDALWHHQRDLDHKDMWGRTPLHYACLHDDEKVIRALLQLGALINAAANDGVVPMHYAAWEGNIDVLKMLMKPPDIGHFVPKQMQIKNRTKKMQDYRDIDGRAPIHWAAIGGHEDVVELWKDSIHLEDNYGYTVLHLAAAYGHGGLIKKLLGWGAHLNATNDHLHTPVHLAANEEALQELINAGANIRAKDESRSTPMQLAFKSKKSILIKAFLQNGAKIDDFDPEEDFALLDAGDCGFFDIMKLFIDFDREGCKDFVRDADMAEILWHLALENWKGSAIDSGEASRAVLHKLSQIIPKDIINGNLWSNVDAALAVAIKKNDVEMATTLLSAGAEFDSEDKKEFESGRIPKRWGDLDQEMVTFLEYRMIIKPREEREEIIRDISRLFNL